MTDSDGGVPHTARHIDILARNADRIRRTMVELPRLGRRGLNVILVDQDGEQQIEFVSIQECCVEGLLGFGPTERQAEKIYDDLLAYDFTIAAMVMVSEDTGTEFVHSIFWVDVREVAPMPGVMVDYFRDRVNLIRRSLNRGGEST